MHLSTLSNKFTFEVYTILANDILLFTTYRLFLQMRPKGLQRQSLQVHWIGIPSDTEEWKGLLKVEDVAAWYPTLQWRGINWGGRRQNQRERGRMKCTSHRLRNADVHNITVARIGTMAWLVFSWVCWQQSSSITAIPMKLPSNGHKGQTDSKENYQMSHIINFSPRRVGRPVGRSEAQRMSRTYTNNRLH